LIFIFYQVEYIPTSEAPPEAELADVLEATLEALLDDPELEAEDPDEPEEPEELPLPFKDPQWTSNSSSKLP
jgi:hypothetical protein